MSPAAAKPSADASTSSPAGGVFTFGRCRLDLRSRMLWRDEQPVALELKAFDVLVHLALHRQRVVSTDELAQAVWAGRKRPLASIHRALALVRQAIGDTSRRNPMIRTVYRVGYQFVAATEIRCVPAVAGARDAGGLRIGCRAAEPEAPQLAAAMSRRFVAALERHLPGQVNADWTEAGSFDFVVELEVHAQGSQIWMDGRILRADGRSAFFGTRAGDREELAERAAQRAADMLGQGERLFAEPAFEDPFAERMHARAVELAALQDVDGAAAVLEVLARLEPDRPPREVGRHLVLRHPRDAQIARYAQQLRDQAAASRDVATARLMGLALAAAGGSAPGSGACSVADPLAADVLDAALNGTRKLGEGDLDVLQFVAGEELLHGTYDDAAIHLTTRVIEVLERSGSLRRVSTLMGFMAAVRILRDELQQASADLERYLALQANHGFLLAFPNACGVGSLLQARLGDHGRSAALADRAILGLAGARLLESETYILSGVALAMFEFGDRTRLRRVCAALEAVRYTDASIDPAALRLSEATLRLAEGHAVDAARLLREAIAGPGLAKQPGARQSWAFALIRLLLLQGDIFGARQQLAWLRSFARDFPSPLLAAWNHRIRASQHLCHGDRQAALDALLDVLLVAPAGQLQLLSCLDAAWLHAECGRPNEAAALWSRAGQWATRHRIGRAVQARIAAARGGFAEAARHQAAAVSDGTGAVPDLQRRLLADYGAAGDGDAVPVRALERFASESWWTA